MGELVLMKGNEAVGEAAIRAGCRFFFGYPITPQNEVPEYLSGRMMEVGGVFLQAESEVAAINMVYGAAATGVRVMTSSSSPGISLKQEGISYICGCDLPCVIVNVARAGPGLGGIQPAQSDYFQATRGGGHGDYKTVVLGPSTVQELFDLTIEAFDIADMYRIPVVILGDGMLGQVMEPVEIRDPVPRTDLPAKTWTVTGARGRPKNIINSLYLQPEVCERINQERFACYQEIQRKEVRWEATATDDADYVLVAYGTVARVVKTVLGMARAAGIKAGVLRPVTLWPFPVGPFAELAARVRAFLVVEMSMGQMVEDVRLAVDGKVPVHFYGRTGGMVPSPREVFARLREVVGAAGEGGGGR